MRLFDHYLLATLALPVLGKSRVEFLIQLPGRVVRHIEQGRLRLRQGKIEQTGREQADQKRFALHAALRFVKTGASLESAGMARND